MDLSNPVCAACGGSPKDLYYSSMAGKWLCDKVDPCARRKARRAAKAAAKGASA